MSSTPLTCMRRRDAAQDGGPLVVGEVAAGAGAQEDAAPRAARLPARSGVGARRAARRFLFGRQVESRSRADVFERCAPASRPPAAPSRPCPWRSPSAACRACSASSGSCAMVRPPRSLMRLMPSVPSPSAPESTMAAACGRAHRRASGRTGRPRRGGRARGFELGELCSWPSTAVQLLAGRDHVDVIGLDRLAVHRLQRRASPSTSAASAAARSRDPATGASRRRTPSPSRGACSRGRPASRRNAPAEPPRPTIGAMP